MTTGSHGSCRRTAVRIIICRVGIRTEQVCVKHKDRVEVGGVGGARGSAWMPVGTANVQHIRSYVAMRFDLDKYLDPANMTRQLHDMCGNLRHLPCGPATTTSHELVATPGGVVADKRAGCGGRSMAGAVGQSVLMSLVGRLPLLNRWWSRPLRGMSIHQDARDGGAFGLQIPRPVGDRKTLMEILHCGP